MHINTFITQKRG